VHWKTAQWWHFPTLRVDLVSPCAQLAKLSSELVMRRMLRERPIRARRR
jgi:hypothetical protein